MKKKYTSQATPALILGLLLVNMNLQSIIHHCKAGDRAAQKTLYEGFSKVFLRLSFRYLNDRHFAEDACLEGFYLIFEGFKHFEYQSDAQTEAWMKRILVNQSLKILRKNKTLLFLQIPEDDFIESNEIGIEDDLSGRELLELITNLPDGYRTVFNMYVVEGYSHSEISAILNITEGTSRSQLFKAKAMLKKIIELKYDGRFAAAIPKPSERLDGLENPSYKI